MRKILLLLSVLCFAVASFSQVNPDKTTSKDYYLQKSKNQKTVGWVLLAGGTGMIVAGILVADNNNDPEDLGYGPNFEAGAGVATAGLAADLLSIPFFISSARNARKAATISFNNQKIMFPGQESFVVKTQPSISLKIKL